MVEDLIAGNVTELALLWCSLVLIGGFLVLKMWLQLKSVNIKLQDTQTESQRVINELVPELRKELADQREHHERLQEKHDLLQGEHTTALQDNAASKARSDNQEKQIETMGKEIAELRDQLNRERTAHIEESKRLTNELTLTRNSLGTTQAELTLTSEKLAQTEKERSEMARTIETLTYRVTQQDARIADLEETVARQTKELAVIAGTLSQEKEARVRAERERDEARRRYKALLAELDKRINKAVDERTAELRAIIAEKDAKIAELERQIIPLPLTPSP
jgi:chromosome segregation ATPase